MFTTYLLPFGAAALSALGGGVLLRETHHHPFIFAVTFFVVSFLIVPDDHDDHHEHPSRPTLHHRVWQMHHVSDAVLLGAALALKNPVLVVAIIAHELVFVRHIVREVRRAGRAWFAARIGLGVIAGVAGGVLIGPVAQTYAEAVHVGAAGAAAAALFATAYIEAGIIIKHSGKRVPTAVKFIALGAVILVGWAVGMFIPEH